MAQKLSNLAKQSLENSNIELRVWQRWFRVKDISSKTFSSPISFFIITIIYCAFYFIPLLPIPNILSNSAIKYIDALWGIQGGILAITVTVVVFIIQSINSRYTRESIFKIFIRKSYILPIIYLNLINIAGMMGLLFYYNLEKRIGLIILTSTIFLISIILIAWLYKSVFDFLDPVKVQEFRINELLKVFEQSLAEELLEKTAERELAEFCKMHGLSYRPWETEINQQIIKANRNGRIVDINLNTILSIKKKYSNFSTQAEHSTLTIIKSIGDHTGEFNRILMEVPNSFNEEPLHKKLVSAFKIRDTDQVEDQLHHILQELSDESSIAISNSSTSQINNIILVFAEICKKFSVVYTLFRKNYPFDPHQILSQTEWNSFTKAMEQFRDLIPNVLTVERVNFLTPVIGVISNIMISSQIVGDSYTFCILQRLFVTFYAHSEKINDNNARRYIRHRSWSLSYDFYRFFLMGPLNKKNADFKNIDFAAEICDNTLKVFSEILRRSIENNDLETFEELNNAIENLTDHYYFRSLDDYRQIEHKLANPDVHGLTTEQILSLKDEIQWLTKLKEMNESLFEKRRALWHALGAWILYNYNSSSIEMNKVRNFYGIIKEEFKGPNDVLRSLITIFERKVDDFYGLTWWIDIPEGKMRYGNWTDLWAFVFYIFRGSELIANDLPESGTPIKTHSSIGGVVDRVKKAMDFIKEFESKWVGEIISKQTWDKFGVFLELNERAHAEQQSIERQRKIEAEISQNLVKQFTLNLIDIFNKTVVFRPLFSKCGKLSSLKQKEKENYLVIRNLPKEMFIKEYETPLIGLDMIGQQIAQEEDKRIAKLIINGIEAENVINTTPTDLVEAVSERVRSFIRNGHHQFYIIFSHNFANPIRLEKVKGFVANWKIPNKPAPSDRFVGLLHEAPVFSALLDQNLVALIVDIDKLGNLYCNEPTFEIKENTISRPDSAENTEKDILEVNLHVDDPLNMDIEDSKAAIVFNLLDQGS